MSVTSYCLSGRQPLLPPPLFQQLWSEHGKTHNKTGYCIQQSRPQKYSDGEGLYFCVRKQGSPYWMIRYTTAKGKRGATLGQFPLMSLADARIAAAYFRRWIRGIWVAPRNGAIRALIDKTSYQTYLSNTAFKPIWPTPLHFCTRRFSF